MDVVSFKNGTILKITRGFRDDKWLTPNTYSTNFDALPDSSGCYLLVFRSFDRGVLTKKVLYVGMSTNIARRISAHETFRLLRKTFTTRTSDVVVYFRRMPGGRIRRAEKRLIKLFAPPFNLQHRQRGV